MNTNFTLETSRLILRRGQQTTPRKEKKDLIGCCGLRTFNIEGQEKVELGYRLRLQCWEQGYATEAAKAAIADGFSRNSPHW